MIKNLTAVAVENYKPGPARKEIPDPGCKGLYLVVHPTGRKTFAVRYRFNGKPKKLTLPKGITLKAARAAAATALHQAEKNSDPSSAKRAEKRAQQIAAGNTFKTVAESYLERESKKKDGERLRSLEWRRALLQRLVYPTLGDEPITKIKRKMVIDLLDKIEDGKLVDKKSRKPIKGGAVMAHSALAVIRKIMRWYAVRDEDYTPPIVPGMGRIKPGERARSRVLSDDELRAVWHTAGQRADPFAALIQFALLTACRRGEAAAMTWDEIDGTDWILPARRNKVKVDLVRPLSQATQELLAARPRIEGCPYVFTYGSKPLANFSQCKEVFDAACGVSDWTLHDLRRSARTLLSRAGVHSDISEQCLGHLLSGVRKIYNRDDFKPQKTLAFDALAALIARIANPPESNVHQIPRRG